MKRTICQIKKNAASGQLIIYVPKDSELVEGDYVDLIKVPEVKNE